MVPAMGPTRGKLPVGGGGGQREALGNQGQPPHFLVRGPQQGRF